MPLPSPYCSGRGGTGGASCGKVPELEPGRFGDGERNVLSVIDPALPRLRSSGPALPWDEVEEDRCNIRLVCISPTGTGVLVAERKAAAAAAFERLAFEPLLARNACVAAV